MGEDRMTLRDEKTGKLRDLRNESRKWPGVGNQKLLDMQLNAFGLELFVESYWETLALLIGRFTSADEVRRIMEPMVVAYRGMTVTLDPRPGLEAAGLVAVKPLPITVDTRIRTIEDEIGADVVVRTGVVLDLTLAEDLMAVGWDEDSIGPGDRVSYLRVDLEGVTWLRLL
jgi:hypothetical protein